MFDGLVVYVLCCAQSLVVTPSLYLCVCVRVCVRSLSRVYVRRNAVLCIYTIYKNFDFLMPDAPEVIYQYLQAEQVRVWVAFVMCLCALPCC